MGQKIIKQFFSRGEDEEKKPIKVWVVFLILGSILFLALGSFPGDEEPKEKKIQELIQEISMDGYIESLEQRLEETVEKISGVGEVSVFLNMEDGGEQVLATNKNRKSQEEKGETEETKVIEEENEIIRWEQDGEEVPFRVKQRLPVPSGILVVAEGAKNDMVRQEIYEAVRAIFGLPAHRIKITN